MPPVVFDKAPLVRSGAGIVSQHMPEEIMGLVPSEIMAPPLIAEASVMEVIGLVDMVGKGETSGSGWVTVFFLHVLNKTRHIKRTRLTNFLLFILEFFKIFMNYVLKMKGLILVNHFCLRFHFSFIS
mgnify:CR=1 FL=1